MTAITTDIDIDFFDRNAAIVNLPHVPAMMVRDGERVRHPSGIYLQDVPVDPITGYCAFDYDEASRLGYCKIDVLSNSLYEGVRDEDHLLHLMEHTPDWSLLEHKAIVDNLAHIREHFGTVRAIKPQSIDDLAVVLALVRPGKRHLTYRPRHEIDAEIWQPDSSGYVFKRAHAIAYAVAIVVQLNLLCEQTAAAINAENERQEMFG